MSQEKSVPRCEAPCEVKFNVLIASHFHIQLRYTFLEDALSSLANQTYKPHKILISYSKADDVVTDVEGLFAKYFGEREGGSSTCIPYFINRSEKQLHQFEHFKKLLDSGQIDGGWIAFCDDDDVYHPERLRLFSEAIVSNPGVEVFTDYLKSFYDKLPSCWLSDVPDVVQTRHRNDFANCVSSYSKFRRFWDDKHIDEWEANGGPLHYADLCFKMILERSPFVEVKLILYFIRKCSYNEHYRYYMIKKDAIIAEK